MLAALLLLPSALAADFNVGLVAGPTVGFGDGPYGSWTSFGPSIGATTTLRLAFVEGWVGAFSATLLNGDDPGHVTGSPLNLLSAQAGFGFGGKGFSAGIYGGPALGGFERGAYARLNLPAGSPVRFGLEGRISSFRSDEFESGAASLLFRTEFGNGARHKEERHPPERRPPPPGYRPPPPPDGPPPPPPPESEDDSDEGEGEAAPVYHDEPYDG